MSNQNTCTIKVDSNSFDKVSNVLIANNWKEEGIDNQYMVFRFKSPHGSIAILYTSGKLVFQGSEDFTYIVSNIDENKSREENKSFSPHIGVDEVGKGDYFGPLVVVGCFVDMDFFKKISYLGFDDSKKFSDKKIMNLFNSIDGYKYFYSSIVYPKEYNRLIKEYRNASLLLAKQHSLVIENGLKDLKEKNIKCEYVVIDQFSNSKSRVSDELGDLGKSIEVIQHHKGESDIAVACASVIARAIFVKEWDKMCNKYNFDFPKGASSVIEKGREFVSIFGKDELDNVAKTSFKTTNSLV